jgi:hypothetical protein
LGDVLAVFQVFDDALDIQQRLLRPFDALARLIEPERVGMRHLAQRLVHRPGPGEHELRTAIAQFQALQAALGEFVLGVQAEGHGKNLRSGFVWRECR